MNFEQEDQKGYFNNNEEEDEERDIGETRNKLPFSSSSSSSSFALQHKNLWLGSFDSQEEYKRVEETAATDFDRNLEFMDLSLANNEELGRSIEKEHMFDKVVTPSDVGKLNRLVIPKQHAEKYFPLDSSSNEKGLLLNFEDHSGKAWRFRYSYWNSSQSYVMTKGWSRFVKEKKLDAGDVVSFQRGAGESDKDRLYIDWRRRPDAPDPTSLARIQLQNQLRFQQSVRWGRFFSLPHQSHVSINPRSYEHLQSQNYGNIYPYNHHHHHQQQQQQMLSFGPAGPTQQYYIRSSSGPSQQIVAVQEGGNAPLVIDSVPVVHGKAAGKRLRLFGVNMDCPIQDESSSYLPPLQSGVPNNNPPLSTAQAEYNSKKGKSSLSFDLDL